MRGSYKWRALYAVMLGTFMSPFDASVANVALPVLGRSFGVGVDATEWVLLAYMLSTASTLALFGRLGDMIGGKRVYLAGFAVFGLSSLACVLAPNFAVLITARAIQGVGAAMLMSTSLAIITQAFPAAERGRAIGLNGAAVATGLTSGPIIGGLIVSHWDWRWIFLINVPISIAGLIVAAVTLRLAMGERQKFDIPGALLAGAALFALCLSLSRAHVWGWDSPLTIGLLAFALLTGALFVLAERRTPSPMIDLDLFENRTFAFSVLASTLYFCAAFAVVFTVPLAAQVALGMNPFHAGLLLLPISALNIFIAPLAGALSDRIPARYISTAGAALFAAGSFTMLFVPVRPSAWDIAGALAIAGLGAAVFTQPNNSTIMGSAPPNRRGVASGILATSRTVGQALGIAFGGAIYFLRAHQLGPLSHTFAPAKAVFAGVAALMIIVGALSYTRGRAYVSF